MPGPIHANPEAVPFSVQPRDSLLCNPLQHPQVPLPPQAVTHPSAAAIEPPPQPNGTHRIAATSPDEPGSLNGSHPACPDVAPLHNPVQHSAVAGPAAATAERPGPRSPKRPAAIPAQDAPDPPPGPDEGPSLADKLRALYAGEASTPTNPFGPHGAHDSRSEQDGADQNAFARRPSLPENHVSTVAVANTLIDHVVQRLKKAPELTEQQQKAIELLLEGHTDREVARQLGIHRTTLWRWRRKDDDFGRALNAQRDRAFRDASVRIRELVPKALDVVQSELIRGNFQAAVNLLRLARIDQENAKDWEPLKLFRSLKRSTD